MSEGLSGSVGRGGDNNPLDVVIVFNYLNNWIIFGALKGRVPVLNKVECDEAMIRAIGLFQTVVVGIRNPDYLIEPGRRTYIALTGPLTTATAAGSRHGPYIYADVDKLEGTDKVAERSGWRTECVALVKRYTRAPATPNWKAGDPVMGNRDIKKGTAVATFVDGKYPNQEYGNHAGFYISQDENGFWIMDQWPDDESKPKVSKRYLPRRGTRADGSYVRPSNNADAFSIIE